MPRDKPPQDRTPDVGQQDDEMLSAEQAAELDELDAVFRSLPDDEGLYDVVLADGFMTALVLHKGGIPSSEWMLRVLDPFSQHEEPRGLVEDPERFFTLLQNRFDYLAAHIRARAPFMPAFEEPNLEDPEDEDDAHALLRWSAGFMLVQQLWPDGHGFDDERLGEPMLALMRHMPPPESPEEARELDELLSGLEPYESFDDAVEDLVMSVLDMAEVMHPRTIVRDGPKVGRNDDCPCGSGLKFKKCHGD